MCWKNAVKKLDPKYLPDEAVKVGSESDPETTKTYYGLKKNFDSALESFDTLKVDKVEGKGLSTEDFTTLLKQKLESLQNYDDTAINEAVNKLRGDFDALVTADASGTIDKFNEIVDFLANIEDSQSLDSIIASIEQQIAGKQDTLSLTVKDNGNIVIGNINGQSKEFMPATPSGDPMHYYYLSHFGVTYNESTGFFELEYLKDLTANDMRNAVRVSGDSRWLYNDASSVSGLVATEDRPRTNIAMKSGNIKVLDRYDTPRWCRVLEQWIIGKCSEYSFATLTNVWDGNDGLRLALIGLAELRYIVGVIDISTLRNGSLQTLLGDSTTKIQEVRLAKMKTPQTIKVQKNLSKDSISYLLSNRINTEEISLSLPAELYNKIMTDGGEWADLRSLCEATTDKERVILELNA